MPIEPSSDFVRVGVCGFCLPHAELFRRFRLMEVQQTFYWPPRLQTVERWRREAPPDFEFTLKAFQAITHTYNRRTYRKVRLSPTELVQCGGFRDTPVVRTAWATTRLLAAALESSLVVFQCPPSFLATDESVEHLRAFFAWAPRGNLRCAWEPRHASWSGKLVGELCRELDLIHAVDPFEQHSVHGTPHYWRLHGKALGHFSYDYDDPYSDAELADLRRRAEMEATYCMFNNKQMADDAERFGEIVRPATKQSSERTANARSSLV